MEKSFYNINVVVIYIPVSQMSSFVYCGVTPIVTGWHKYTKMYLKIGNMCSNKRY